MLARPACVGGRSAVLHIPCAYDKRPAPWVTAGGRGSDRCPPCVGDPCARVRVCVRVCMRVCVCVCMRQCACARACAESLKTSLPEIIRILKKAAEEIAGRVAGGARSGLWQGARQRPHWSFVAQGSTRGGGDARALRSQSAARECPSPLVWCPAFPPVSAQPRRWPPPLRPPRRWPPCWPTRKASGQKTTTTCTRTRPPQPLALRPWGRPRRCRLQKSPPPPTWLLGAGVGPVWRRRPWGPWWWVTLATL